MSKKISENDLTAPAFCPHPERLRLRFAGVSGLAVYPPGATFGPRTMRDFEFVWIVDGECAWEADGVRHAAPPGTVILCRPGVRDFFQWDREQQTRHAYFHFSLDDDGAGLPPRASWADVRYLPEGDIVRPLFRHVAWLLEEGRPEHRVLAESAARQLLLSFLSGALLTRPEGSIELSDPVVRTVRFVERYWREHPGRNPALGELARAAAVSEGHLCRLFKAQVGCGPLQALRLIRVDRAASLLARTNLRIKAVAHRMGFENPYHFSRCFKEAYGISPRAFRRKAELGQAQPKARVLRVRRVMRVRWE